IASKVEFTNIKCTSLDKEFDDFEYCYLKSVNRTYKYMSLKVNLYKIPITIHDLLVDKLPVSFVNRHFTQVLPFPEGEYLFQSNWFAYNVSRAQVNFYFTLS
ncbi:GL13981, partial [Drosophila persimilis]